MRELSHRDKPDTLSLGLYPGPQRYVELRLPASNALDTVVCREGN
jgi:hypothetical protein